MDLRPYVPQLLIDWVDQHRGSRHWVIPGTLVFADISGFTALSERLARKGGKAGAEEMTAILNGIFAELLGAAGLFGGEMLKYGGDAALLLFRGDDHARRAAAACAAMQATLRRVGRIDTGHGTVRLRMSVGVHTGDIDTFVVGDRHSEMVVAGPATTTTAAMETAAQAGEVLVSATTAAALSARHRGPEKAGGVLLRGNPRHEQTEPRPLAATTDLEHLIPVGLRRLLGSGAVEADHRPATIGFLHLMDLDRRLASDPAAAADALHDTIILIQEVFDDLGVTFLATDLVGDGTKVVAAAGVPEGRDDAEERMLRALRRIVTAGTPLPVRAGAHAGHVYAGDVGAPFRRAYTVIGDVVNTAARVMARAEAGEVLTLLPVLERTRTELEAEELEPFMAKGKSEPLVPWRVGEPTGRQRVPGRLPLVGRNAELAALRGAVEKAATGSGGLVAITGEPGIGKTRLVEELLSVASGLRVVQTTCSPYDAATPYAAVRGLLRELIGAPNAASLRRVVAASVPQLEPWLPLMGIALDLDLGTGPETEALDPAAVPERLRAAVGRLLEATVVSPTLAVVEDSYWCDADSARLLESMERLLPNMPLVVVASRRDMASGFAGGPTAMRIDLAPLGTGAITELVRLAVGRPLLPDAAQALVERSGGNPLLLRELARALATTGDVAALPASIESLVGTRIDSLDPADRRVLRAAAVVGMDVPEDHLHAALGAPVPPTAWDRVAEFIEPAGSQRRFRHALVREAAYEGLPYRLRRELHRRLGVHLEAVGDPSEHVELLAGHFSAAGDAGRTWRYCVGAGDRAAGKYAHAAAAGWYGQALDAVPALSDRPETTETERVADRLHEALVWAGMTGEALTVVTRELRQRNTPIARRVRLIANQAELLVTAGDMDRAIKRARTGRRLARTHGIDDATVTRLHLIEGMALIQKGSPKRARDSALLAEHRAGGMDDPVGYAHALACRYWAELLLRDPARQATGAAAYDAYSEADRDGSLGAQRADLINNMAIDAHAKGDWVTAARLLGESRQVHAAAGRLVDAAVVGYNEAHILAQQGHLDRADAIAADALDVLQAAGHLVAALASSLVVWIRGLQGHPAPHAALVEDARTTFVAIDQGRWANELDLRVAEGLLLAGATDDALAVLVAVDTDDADHQSTRQRLLAVASAVTDTKVAAGHARDAIRFAQEGDHLYERALALDLLASLAERSERDASRRDADALLAQLGVVAVPAYPQFEGSATTVTTG